MACTCCRDRAPVAEETPALNPFSRICASTNHAFINPLHLLSRCPEDHDWPQLRGERNSASACASSPNSLKSLPDGHSPKSRRYRYSQCSRGPGYIHVPWETRLSLADIVLAKKNVSGRRLPTRDAHVESHSQFQNSSTVPTSGINASFSD